jgi:hypothetical protein
MGSKGVEVQVDRLGCDLTTGKDLAEDTDG